MYYQRSTISFRAVSVWKSWNLPASKRAGLVKSRSWLSIAAMVFVVGLLC